MRTLLRFSIDAVPGNRATADGRIGPLLGALLEALQPEASYFLTLDGRRTGLVVFDLKEPSQIPTIAEPLFRGLDATVEFVPCMTPAELQAGMARASEGR